jgi:hypothetical protein
MGGFVFDTSKLDPGFLKHGQVHATLTHTALRVIAKGAPSYLPDISKEAIRDKSKANSFAKFLVCVQTCWFIAQTSGRLATRLPISLLEMNTLLHAVCCLLIYLAWWHKPLDIGEPYLIDASDPYLQKILAWMRVKDGDNENLNAFEDDSRGYSEMLPSISKFDRSELVYEDDIDWNHATVRVKRMLNQNHARIEEVMEPDYNNQWVLKHGSEAARLKLYPGQKIHGFVLCNNWSEERLSLDLYTTLSIARIERLKLVRSLRCETKNGHLWDRGGPGQLEGNMLTFGTSLTKSSDKALAQWRRHSTHLSPGIVLWSGLIIAGSFYGGIHLFAWNGPFTTKAQRLLWQISCLIIVSPVILIVVGFFVGFLLLICFCILDDLVGPYLDRFDWSRKISHWAPMLDDVFAYTFRAALGIFGIMYTTARLYLVVECFINIAHLPEGVFEEPRWSRYIPHFGAG